MQFQLVKNRKNHPNEYQSAWYISSNVIPSSDTARWIDELKDGDKIEISVRDYHNDDSKATFTTKKFKLVEIK